MQNTNTPKRSAKDYQDLTRLQVQNHLRTETTKPQQAQALNPITAFLGTTLWSWIKNYVKSRFGPNHPYPEYTGDENGIYALRSATGSTSVSVAVTFDWATDTEESVEVAKQMASHSPDYTIHGGDTYYVGAPPEINSNFIEAGSPWVRGSVGSFAILGNHEMFARGIAFFDILLGTLGIKNASGQYGGQKAGFFCLENDHWRILGLDTGYHSIGKIPILELIPLFGPDCHFDDKLMTWLRNTVRLGDSNDKRGILVLTHHQYITAFRQENEFTKPAKQLAELLGSNRPLVWLCGHEHKFAMYEKFSMKDCVTAYMRCVGQGGMPVDLNSKSFQTKRGRLGYDKLGFTDTRKYKTEDNITLGFNGYMLLTTENEKLTISYRDNTQLILSETWTANSDGTISGSIQAPDPSLNVAPAAGKSWQDLVK